MKAWDIWPRFRDRAAFRLRRAYRHSELRKFMQWLKGKSLHWAIYLAVVSLMAGGVLGLHSYIRSFFFVVTIGDREVGFVRDTVEVEDFVTLLTERCSELYGLSVQPGEEISLLREYRPEGEADPNAVKEALRRRITLVTEAVMLTVDNVHVLPVAAEEDVQMVIELLSSNYIIQADNIKLLDVFLVEEITGEPCTVPPEYVFPATEVAALLIAEKPLPERVILSRGGPAAYAATVSPAGEQDQDGVETALPAVHVITREEVTVDERIPFSTTYTYTGSLWSVQSRITVPGKDGSKEVVYHVTRENGVETARLRISEKVLVPPVTQVVEKGTARVPAMGTGRFVWPVQGGGFLTQGFRGWNHAGIDIAAPTGTPIFAADSGVVVISEYIPWPQGNYIVIYHGGYWTVYLHNNSNRVSKGDTVKQGDVIAYIGRTGRTTGPHLHFEIRKDDGSGVWNHWRQHAAVDPLSFFSPR